MRLAIRSHSPMMNSGKPCNIFWNPSFFRLKVQVYQLSQACKDVPISYSVNMNWKDITTIVGALVTLLIAVFSMWYHLDSKIETRIGGLDTKFDAKFERIDMKFERLDTKFDAKFERIDAKFDALNKLLTDNLLVMKGDIGELKGRGGT